MSESNDLNHDDLAALQAVQALQALQLLEAGAIVQTAATPSDVTSSDASAVANQTPGFEAAVAAIPYGAPSMPMAADLKERLFQRIATDAVPAEPSIDASNAALEAPADIGPAVVSVRTDERNWVPHETVDGIMVSLLHVDEVRRIVTCLMKVDAGVQYPNHNHRQIEEIFMLSGDMTLGDQVYTEGDYVRFEAGFAHAPGSRTGCTILIKSPMEEVLLSAA